MFAQLWHMSPNYYYLYTLQEMKSRHCVTQVITIAHNGSHSIQKSAKTFAAKLNKSNCVGVVVGPHKTLVLVPDLCLVHKCFQPFQVQVPGSEGLESCPTVTAVIQLRTLLWWFRVKCWLQHPLGGNWWFRDPLWLWGNFWWFRGNNLCKGMILMKSALFLQCLEE